KQGPESMPADSPFSWSAGVVLAADLALALPTVAAPSRFLYLTFPVELRRLFFSRGCALQSASMKHAEYYRHEEQCRNGGKQQPSKDRPPQGRVLLSALS